MKQVHRQSTAPAELRIPARPEFFAATLEFAEQLAQGLEFTANEKLQIRLALEECLGFLQRATLLDRAGEPLRLGFEPQADGLVIRIIAKGLPLNLAELPEYVPPNVAGDADADGLSLLLARKTMDRLGFTNLGRAGLELEIFKQRKSAHVRQRREAPPDELPDTPSAADTFQPYVIRPLRPAEAIEVSRCAYLTYGHTYENFIYYPERILELNQNGGMRSLVAVTADGTIMGHCALKFMTGRSNRAELGVLFVKPQYRKHGLGAALWAATVAEARKTSLVNIFARSVTGHRASQAMARQNGFNDFALYLSMFPNAVDLKEMGGKQPGKMSGMLQSLCLTAPRRRTLAPPARHAAIITELYRRAGIRLTPAGTGRAPATQPIMKVTRAPVLNIAIMELESCGAESSAAQAWMPWILRRLCREKTDVIYLYLNLEERAAAAVAESCADEGFIFSGIAPDFFTGGDALVLQYLNTPQNPFEQMTVWTDTARLLLEYIRDEWSKNEIQIGNQL